jgi:hypothetical protein
MAVIAGLDPANPSLFGMKVDAQVEPGHDSEERVGVLNA